MALLRNYKVSSHLWKLRENYNPRSISFGPRGQEKQQRKIKANMCIWTKDNDLTDFWKGKIYSSVTDLTFNDKSIIWGYSYPVPNKQVTLNSSIRHPVFLGIGSKKSCSLTIICSAFHTDYCPGSKGAAWNVTDRNATNVDVIKKKKQPHNKTEGCYGIIPLSFVCTILFLVKIKCSTLPTILVWVLYCQAHNEMKIFSINAIISLWWISTNEQTKLS